MNNLFNEGPNIGETAPSMLMEDSGQPDFSNYKYRVERFSLGGSDEFDESAAMESLLTRSIRPERDVVLIERKDSISATTGVYTCIVIYLEKTIQQQGE